MAEELAEIPPPDADDDRTLAQRLNDASLAANVKLALAEESALRAYNFETEARRGVVLLQGDVPSSREYALAEQVARRVEGVRGVENQIVAPELDLPSAAESVSVGNTGVGTQTPAAKEPATPAAAPSEPASESSEAYHTVASGESLWEIARKNGTTIDAIRRLNNLQGDRIRPGQRLRVR